MEQAEAAWPAAPSEARALLDSVKNPVLLSDEWLTRYCVLACQLADSIGSPFPYEDDLDRALYYLEQHGSLLEQARMGFYWGRALQEEGLYRPALNAFKEAEMRSRVVEDWHLTARVCQSICELFHEQADYDSAIQWMKKSVELFEQTADKRSLGLAYRRLGRELAALDSFDLAMDYMHQADSVIWQLGDSADISTIYNGIGNVYHMMGNLPKAKEYLYKSIAFDPDDSAPTCAALGRLYLYEDSLKQAEYYLNEARKPTSNPDTHEELIYHFSKLERKKGNLIAALDSVDSYVSHWEKYILRLRNTDLAEAEALFDRKQMTKENVYLRKIVDKISSIAYVFGMIALGVTVIHLCWKSKQKDKTIQLTQEIALRESQLKEKEAEQQTLLEQSQNTSCLYEENQQQILKLKKEIACKNQQLWERSSIYIKIKKMVKNAKPGDNLLLDPKDFENLKQTIDSIYTDLKAQFAQLHLSGNEQDYCYLSFLQITVKDEALLLGKEQKTVEQAHTRLRKKLNFPKEKGPIWRYFMGI